MSGGKGEEKFQNLILIVCYMTVEGPSTSQNSVAYQAIENLIRNSGNQKILIVCDKWSCRYFRGKN